MFEFVVVIQDGLIVDGYPQSDGHLGYRLEDILSKPLTELAPPEDRQGLARTLEMIVDGLDSGAAREARVVDAKGSIRWIEARSAVVSWNGKPAAIILGHDITERKDLEKLLQERIVDRETMLKEIHHRVKNNMQVIASLLSLQAQQVKDQETADLFRDSQARIRAMAMIHEVLHQSETFTRIHLDRYLTRLAEAIIRGHSASGQVIRLDAAVGPIRLGLDQAIPIGLAVNEIIMNAIKHAFAAGRPGCIEIRSRTLPDDWIEILVRDDGVGLPDEILNSKPGTLGIPLVFSLVERQLGGRITVERNGGTAFTLALRVREDKIED